MSADNYWLVRRHPEGGFAPVMGFVSDDVEPTVSVHQGSYESPEAALAAVMGDYAEYGHSIHAECFEDEEENHRYAEGGLTEGRATTIRLDPDECIVLAADARAGRLVCGRPDHPTTTSGCKR